MEIRDLAERVLFGRTLAEKLIHPEELTDERPGVALARAPAEPERPAGLALVRRARVPFPALAHLDQVDARGHALHHFASHELLAMELMALALLRFPDAPPAFRRGLVAALHEEQAHFALYQARMGACGVPLGAVPASALFWDALAGMASPLDFVAGMSLTFEQANLDYAGFYRRAFAAVGDAETAAVLDQVYEDEIGHVKLGLVWFRRWLSPGPDAEWAAYTEALPTTLQPSRAKGLEFDAEARRRAGFTEGYIDTLRVFSRSRGRVPDLHVFDPAAEIVLAGRPVPAVAETLRADLEALPMFLAAADDAVLVRRPPRPAFLAPLAEAGFTLPEFVTPEAAADRTFRQRRPWADLAATPAHLFRKSWAAGLLAGLAEAGDFADAAVVGAACRTLAEVEAHATRLRALGFAPLVAKADLATAGRGHIPLGDALPVARLRRVLAIGPVVVEPWLDRVLDLGLQLHVSDTGWRLDAITRGLVDARGQHRGVALTRLAAGLPEHLRRWLMGAATQAALRRAADHVGAALHGAGHRGFAGVDALVYRRDGAFHLKPIVEVNPRTTMGRVALGLRRRVAPGAAAAWIQVPTPVDATPHLQVRGQPPLIEDAVLFTTDPEGARFTTLLVVAPTVEALAARLAAWTTAVDPLVSAHESVAPGAATLGGPSQP